MHINDSVHQAYRRLHANENLQNGRKLFKDSSSGSRGAPFVGRQKDDTSGDTRPSRAKAGPGVIQPNFLMIFFTQKIYLPIQISD